MRTQILNTSLLMTAEMKPMWSYIWVCGLSCLDSSLKKWVKTSLSPSTNEASLIPQKQPVTNRLYVQLKKSKIC